MTDTPGPAEGAVLKVNINEIRPFAGFRMEIRELFRAMDIDIEQRSGAYDIAIGLSLNGPVLQCVMPIVTFKSNDSVDVNQDKIKHSVMWAPPCVWPHLAPI